MKVNELIALLQTEDPNKELRLDIHTGDSIHKEENILSMGVSNIRREEKIVWICYKPDHISNVYSASGYATLIENAE